jgi:hypothetical protein
VDQAWHQKSSFEMLIVETLQEIGPVIAIGRPGDRLPPLGAAREYVQNGEWHTRVQSLIKQAGVIVVLLGEGEGLKWELNELQRLQAWPNTLVVVPPWSRPERDETWNTLITLAAGTQLAGTLSQADPRTTLLFMGDASDRITPVRCVSTAPSAYALAVKTALVHFARRAGKLRAAPTAA